MARPRRGDPTPEELALMAAQAKALGAQTAQAREDTLAKQRIALQQIEAERAMTTEKLGLGREEIGSKEKQTQLQAALAALETGSKADIAREGERGASRTELTRRADIPQDVLATALAEGGDASLYNALARKKVQDRETAINTLLPAITSAKSDTERAKITAGLAAFPGADKEAVARAFPKPEYPGAGDAPAPDVFKPTTATAPEPANNFSALANTLLTRAGVTPAAPTAAAGPGTYAAGGLPDVRYTPLGHGSLEGSQRVAGGIQTPSGGFIGGTLGEDRLAKLITPRGEPTASPTATNTAGLIGPPIPVNEPGTATTPPVNVPLVAPPPLQLGQLLAPQPTTIGLDFAGQPFGSVGLSMGANVSNEKQDEVALAEMLRKRNQTAGTVFRY